MSDFNYQPEFGAQVQREPRVLLAGFGDGYEQRAADGINTSPQTWSVSFTRSSTDIDTIEAFLVLKAGVTSFTWTPKDGSEIRVVCAGWQRSKTTLGIESLTTTFRQIFQ